MGGPEWTAAQKDAALYCAETLRALTKLDPKSKECRQLLIGRGKNAVAQATEAGLFKHIDG